MSFVDELRKARIGRATVVHEYLTNYAPHARRVHAFVEGYEDVVFYRAQLALFAGPEFKIFTYRCGNKQAVYTAYEDLLQRGPIPPYTLFFVDKDLSDLVAEVWPTHDSIYVTDWYSIENYFVTQHAFERLCLECIRLRNCNISLEPVFRQFEGQLQRFHNELRSIMAWVIVVRRRGLRPNLQNIQMGDLLQFKQDCALGSVPGRLAHLERMTGIASPVGVWREVRGVLTELDRMEAKSFVRGKFESWFLATFLQHALEHLRTVAAEEGGSVGLAVNINAANLVEALVARVLTPPSLRQFLARHFPQQHELDLA